MFNLLDVLRRKYRELGLRAAPKCRRRSLQIVEGLETRTLLASIMTANTLTYQDIDGDTVSVTFSKPILTSPAVANSIFTFSAGNVNGSNTTKQQLQTINLTGLTVAAVGGAKITTVAVRSAINGDHG